MARLRIRNRCVNWAIILNNEKGDADELAYEEQHRNELIEHRIRKEKLRKKNQDR
jgi:hypothetical protein